MKQTHLFALTALLVGLFVLTGCKSEPRGLTAEQVAELPDKQMLNLYPGTPPGKPTWTGKGEMPKLTEKRGRLSFVHVPTLEVRHAKGDNRTGAAVVICPGGGYRILAHGHEGDEVATWLTANGITAVILRYRMFPYRHPVPMMDVQRALQTVRASSAKWGIDPQRIGVLGFSAGGHLASTAATHHMPADKDSKDPVERVTSRPDFAVLLYPVITFRDPVGHGGSRRNLIGPEPDEKLVALLSNDEQVDETTPPTFLVHSQDDWLKIKNSELFYAALKKHNVPAELMVFKTGGHGYGLGRARNDPDKTHETDAWPARCIQWLGEQGFVPGKQK